MDKNTSQVLVVDGGSVKATGEGIVEGLGIVFGSENQTDQSPQRDFFTADSFVQKRSSFSVPLFLEHGLGITDEQIGEAVLTKQDEGWHAKAEIDTTSDVGKTVYEAVKKKQFGFSTGAMQHLVRREAKANGSHFLKKWVVGELSLTERPAERKAVVQAVKSLDGEVVYEDAFKDESLAPKLDIHVYNADGTVFWDSASDSPIPDWDPTDKAAKKLEIKHTNGSVQYNVWAYDEDREVGTDITVYEWGNVNEFIDHLRNVLDKAADGIKNKEIPTEKDFKTRVEEVVKELLREDVKIAERSKELDDRDAKISELQAQLDESQKALTDAKERMDALSILADANQTINKLKGK